MKQSADRPPARQFPILLGMLLPGGGLFLWGISACASAHHFTMPGAAGVIAGLSLVIAGGCYHYLTDFRDARGRRSFAAFLGLTAFSALTAFLVHHVLFR